MLLQVELPVLRDMKVREDEVPEGHAGVVVRVGAGIEVELATQLEAMAVLLEVNYTMMLALLLVHYHKYLITKGNKEINKGKENKDPHLRQELEKLVQRARRTEEKRRPKKVNKIKMLEREERR